MQIFLSVGYQEVEQVTLNHCWLNLHVIFLSDICNGTDMAIDNQFWSGKATSHQPTSILVA